MLETVIIVLLILWLLGIVGGGVMYGGGAIHLLFVLAIVFIVIRLLQGRDPLA